MNSNVFLFNESSQILFQLQLFHRGAEGRTSNIYNAKIKLEGNVITMSINIPDGLNSQNLSRLLNKPFRKKNYKISHASIEGKNILLKIDEEIKFIRFHTGNGQCICSMRLKEFYYEYKGSERPRLYRLSKTASVLLRPYLTSLSARGNKVVGTVTTTYDGSFLGMPFCMFRDEHHVYVQTEGDINILLRDLSLFFCNPIEYDMEFSYDNDRKIRVISTQFNVQAVKGNDVLGYLFSGDICLGHLYNFINLINSCNDNSITENMIEAYISNYVRVEYLDNISKLLLYSSILEKMANAKIGDDTYDVIKDYLHKNHINIDKVNDNIENENILDIEGKEISNFVKLRNFFVHHLGSKEAECFLNKSDLLFYLKITITILILKKIGIPDITFDKNFKGISVFDKSVGCSNCISNNLKSNIT